MVCRYGDDEVVIGRGQLVFLKTRMRCVFVGQQTGVFPWELVAEMLKFSKILPIFSCWFVYVHGFGQMYSRGCM